MNRIAAPLTLTLFLSACGGSNGPWSGSDEPPSAVSALAGNAGDASISIGWRAPTNGDGPFTYRITATPSPGSLQIIQSGIGAVVRGLTNGTAYTFTVTAENSDGEGPAATIQLQPSAFSSSNYPALTLTGNNTGNDSSGIFDPALLRLGNGDIWMAYSNVDYHGTPQIKAVSTSIAKSSDGGQTFVYANTLGATVPATVTNTTGVNICGSNTCSGYWVYEVPFLVDDSNDPDSSRRFKLFAHKYFLYPPAQNSTIYTLGAIVMWTAAAPDGTWSAEQRVLGWNATPPELTAMRNVNSLDSDLSNCLAISEGSATPFNGALDFVFACSYLDGNTIRQKIIQLRSTDHTNSFSYIATLLSADDATAFNAEYFSAPSLIATESAAPLLIATPVINRNISVNGNSVALDAYSGCIAFPLVDQQNGALLRNNNAPLSILEVPLIANRLNGACSAERGLNNIGMLMNVANPTTATPQFSIVNTAKTF